MYLVSWDTEYCRIDLYTGGVIYGHPSMYLVSWDTEYCRIDLYTGGVIYGHPSMYLVSWDTSSSIAGLTYVLRV